MKKNYVVMDGNTAAAYSAYAFTEVAAIYPITPSSPMAEKVGRVVRQGQEEPVWFHGGRDPDAV